MYFVRMLSLMNWFDLQIDSNDVNVNIFFHIEVQADLKHFFIKDWSWKTSIVISMTLPFKIFMDDIQCDIFTKKIFPCFIFWF